MNKIKSFRKHLDEQYGKPGTATRDEFEQGFEAFKAEITFKEKLANFFKACIILFAPLVFWFLLIYMGFGPQSLTHILEIPVVIIIIISAYAIYNIHGHRITQSQVDHYELELDMQSYAPGVYILQLYDSDGAMWSERVVRM